MYSVAELSSLNLRASRGKPARTLEKPIRFQCDVCRVKYRIGDDEEVYVRVQYELQKEMHALKLCGKCVDIFADLCIYGPRVVQSASTWSRRSRVVRMLAIRENLFCFNCQLKADSHIFVKYDNMVRAGKPQYDTRRVCARCAVSYLEMMRGNKKRIKDESFPFYEASDDQYVRPL